MTSDETVDKERDHPIDASEGEGSGAQGELKNSSSSADDDMPECGRCDEAEQPISLKVPRRPSAQDVADHELTHCPYRAWCDDCVRGQAKDAKHSTVHGGLEDSTVTRVNMDYAFLKEDVTEKADEHESSTKARVSLTFLVVQESMCRSVWAYAVESKGSSEVWLTDQIVEDMETVGVTSERIILKSDQEPAITDLQRSIVARRAGHGTALEKSRVGDSNSNGRIERCIQDVKGLVRTIKSSVERKTGAKIHLEDAVTPWIIRHAAHIITRCRVRDNGRTAYQEMKGRRTNAKMVPFGEAVLFKIPKTQFSLGDFQDRWEMGVWVGFMMRSGEHCVATANGVFRVSTIMRRPEGKQWSSSLVKDMKGTPKEPVPGKSSRHIPAFAKKFEDTNENKAVFLPVPQAEQEIRSAYIYIYI